MQHKPLILALLAGLSLSGAAQAALIDRGGGLIYDTDLNVTWLQNANVNGAMTWAAATTWAATLVYHDSVRNVDYSDWRLPTTAPINGSTFNYGVNYGDSNNGTTDLGYNISAPGTAYAGSKGSELAYLFFNELGNKAYLDTSGNLQAGYGVTNAGPFQNLQPSIYWSGTEFAPNTHRAWVFALTYGNQDTYGKADSFYAMAVRPGDVAGSGTVLHSVPNWTRIPRQTEQPFLPKVVKSPYQPIKQ